MPPSLNLHSRHNFSPNQRGHIATVCLSALSAVTGDTFTSYRKNHPWVIIEHVPKSFSKESPSVVGGVTYQRCSPVRGSLPRLPTTAIQRLLKESNSFIFSEYL